MNQQDHKEITIPILAQLLGVTRVTIWRRVRKGEIPARKVGRTYVITDEVVQEILGKQTSEQTKEQIDSAVEKTVSDYGDVLKELGKH